MCGRAGSRAALALARTKATTTSPHLRTVIVTDLNVDGVTDEHRKGRVICVYPGNTQNSSTHGIHCICAQMSELCCVHKYVNNACAVSEHNTYALRKVGAGYTSLMEMERRSTCYAHFPMPSVDPVTRKTLPSRLLQSAAARQIEATIAARGVGEAFSPMSSITKGCNIYTPPASPLWSKDYVLYDMSVHRPPPPLAFRPGIVVGVRESIVLWTKDVTYGS